jgi:hypothetical protein
MCAQLQLITTDLPQKKTVLFLCLTSLRTTSIAAYKEQPAPLIRAGQKSWV